MDGNTSTSEQAYNEAEFELAKAIVSSNTVDDISDALELVINYREAVKENAITKLQANVDEEAGRDKSDLMRLVRLRDKVEEFKKAEEETHECSEMVLSGHNEKAARLMGKLEAKKQDMYKALENAT